MTREQALQLQPGDRVIVHASERLTPPKSVERVIGKTVTVVRTDTWTKDVLVVVQEIDTALFWDEVEFAQPSYVDEDLHEGIIGDLSDLFGGEVL